MFLCDSEIQSLTYFREQEKISVDVFTNPWTIFIFPYIEHYFSLYFGFHSAFANSSWIIKSSFIAKTIAVKLEK